MNSSIFEKKNSIGVEEYDKKSLEFAEAYVKKLLSQEGELNPVEQRLLILVQEKLKKIA